MISKRTIIIFVIGLVNFNCSQSGVSQLEINPEIKASSYLGGSRNEMGYCITTDLSGNIYVTGKTDSPDFPSTSKFLPDNIESDNNVFVVKMDPAGSKIIYSLLIGGSGDDSGGSVSVDGKGYAFVSGTTGSKDFPTTPGCFDKTLNGKKDVFIVKIDPDGKSLVYSTYLGGDKEDFCLCSQIDNNGCIYLSGKTLSENFPVTSGVFDETFNGKNDVFVSKLNINGTKLEYSTFIGGSNEDSANDLTIDDLGCIYFCGETQSSNYPVTDNSFDQAFNGGGYDVVVTKLNSDGTELVYSTYLGGDKYEWASGIEVDHLGNAYVSGATKSEIFPVTENALDNSFNGDQDLFVTVFNKTGDDINYSTFIGGISKDSFTSIGILNKSGDICLTGNTKSSDYPVTSNASDTTFNKGQFDTFYSIINVLNSKLVYSTFLGGSCNEWGLDIYADRDMNAYLTGFTDSPDFPVTSGSFDIDYNGEINQRIKGDVFFIKFSVK